MELPFVQVFPAPPPAPQVAAAQLIYDSNELFQKLIESFNDNYNLVWNNPSATPPEVVTALGVNGLLVFEASAGLATYLNSLGASPALPTSIPTGWNFQANPDGSVTLTAAG